MGNVYWDKARMQSEGEFPSILAFGDSWFWYPLNNLLNPTHRFSGQPTILCFGANGATATQLASGFYFAQFQEAIKDYGAISMVMLSAGGNDFAGFDNLRKILRPDCSKAKNLEDCFIDSQLKRLLNSIRVAYEKIMGCIFAYHKEVKVLIHHYDYAIPTGIGYLGLGQALKAPMDACRVPEPDNLAADSFRCRLIKQLIDDLAQSLDTFVYQYPAAVVHIPSAGTLKAEEWANELHPTPEGFNRLALQHFSPIVRQILIGA